MEKGSIVNNVTYTMKTGKRADFLREMRESGLLEAVRSEEGCLLYAYFIPEEDDGNLFLLEKWRDKECLSGHVANPNMAKVKAVKAKYIEETVVEKFFV